MNSSMGFGRRHLVAKIIKDNWGIDPNKKNFNFNELLFVIQEMMEEEGKNYLQGGANNNRGHNQFRRLVKYLLYRNLANYDSMLLLTSEKGCCTMDTLIEMPRDLIKYPRGIPIKDLVGKKDFYVYSFNFETNKLELKHCDGCEFVKEDDVYELELLNGTKITATKDHPFFMTDGTKKEMKDIIYQNSKGKSVRDRQINGKRILTDRLRIICRPAINDPNDNRIKIDYSPIDRKNGDTPLKHGMTEHRFIMEQLGYDIEGKIVHHKDENHFNNVPENLKAVEGQKEHYHVHKMENYQFGIGNKYCKNTGYSTKKKYRVKIDSQEFKDQCRDKRINFCKSNGDKISKVSIDREANNFNINSNHINRGIRVKSIKYIGKRKVYDIVNVKDNHNFIANGMVVGNTGKSSAGIMLCREWCKQIGIQFNAKRHIAYNNADIMNKIDALNPFEPILCLAGETRITIRKNSLRQYVEIKDLIHLNNYEILAYDVKNDKQEWSTCDGAVLNGYEVVDTIELENGIKVRATPNHKFITKNRGIVKLKDLTEDDELILETKKTTSKIKKITRGIKKEKVYTISNVKKHHSYYCNSVATQNCDEAIRFACITGSTQVLTDKGNIQIKDLVNKTNFKVYSYNEQTKDVELQTAKKCIKVKEDYVYRLKTECGKIIKATKEHKFLTVTGWKQLIDLTSGEELINNIFIHSIIRLNKVSVYDIINVSKNNNYIANNIVVHNSSADWNKKANKELKKKLAQVRTKHLFYVLCFPLKVYKLEKTYLESFVNYWIDLFGRGIGGCYVKDANPVKDAWGLDAFKKIPSYNEFTTVNQIRDKLKKHPNFWQIIRFPKPPAWLYTRYLQVREANVYDDTNVMASVTKEDIQRALLILALRDIMMNDVQLTMNRIIVHIKNEYDIKLTKAMVENILGDSKQLINKIREEIVSSGQKTKIK